MRFSIALIVFVAACKSGTVTTDTTTTAPSVDSGAAAQPKVRVTNTASPNDAANGIAAFAQDLYGKLDAPNTFYSPASLGIALAMTYVGARGDTAAQMAKVLHIAPTDRQALSFAALQANLRAPSTGGPELRVANRLYGSVGFTFDAAFINVTRDEFDAPLERIDFGSANATRTINDWVSHETHEKIRDLIAPGMLTQLTRLVLVDAIYFKGTWQRPFDASLTQSEPFFGKGGTKNALLMHQRMRASYAEKTSAQVLELAYAGESLVMDIILPKTKDGLVAAERAIATDGLRQLCGSLSLRDVDIALPKLTIVSSFEVSPTLAALGMPIAFTDSADFSGITPATKLRIDAVVHKAFVDVSELGTEAAAATAITTGVAGAPPTAEPPIRFRADHPFVFVIRDKRIDAILFVGRFSDPT